LFHIIPAGFFVHQPALLPVDSIHSLDHTFFFLYALYVSFYCKFFSWCNPNHKLKLSFVYDDLYPVVFTTFCTLRIDWGSEQYLSSAQGT